MMSLGGEKGKEQNDSRCLEPVEAPLFGWSATALVTQVFHPALPNESPDKGIESFAHPIWGRNYLGYVIKSASAQNIN